jgi:hypothetical protein
VKKLLVAIAIGALSMSAYAGPASTFSADVNDYENFMVTDAQGALRNCSMKTTLKVPGSKKDLLIGVSLQSGIMTETKVKGQKGDTDLASADGSVNVAVILDGDYSNPVAPGIVTFNSRKQELEATLGGVLESCSFNCPVADGVATCNFDKDDCIWSDEDIRLMLETTSANHFNFVAPDVGVGEHTLMVCVGIAANASADNGSAASWAAVNLGSLTVEVVKSANTADGITID